MKLDIIKIFLLIPLFFSLQCFAENVTWYDLEKKGELFYLKSEKIPFTGKITGKENGNIVGGKKDGVWLEFWNNGNLSS